MKQSTTEQRNDGFINSIFPEHCFMMLSDRRKRLYMSFDVYHWYVIDGTSRTSEDHYISVMQGENWDQVVDKFKAKRNNPYCINVDRLCPTTAKVYGIPYLLEEKHYVNLF